MDHSIGYFIEQAKQAGYLDNTLFVFWGDHGISGYTGEHLPPYLTQTELSGMHVPLLIYGPGLIKQGKVYDKVASELDILPTIAGLAAPEYTNTSMGRDLLDPQFDDQAYAFTITHRSVPEIGLLAKDFYFRMNADGSNKRLHDIRQADSRQDSSGQHPAIAAELEQLCVNLYETAKYLRYHNAHEELRTSVAQH